jgi:hypothetical protein
MLIFFDNNEIEEQKQKTLPATHVKRKQMDEELTNTKNKKIRQEKKPNRPVRKSLSKKKDI